MAPASTEEKVMPRQYVAVKFGSSQKGTYTYHNDGPPVRVGDTVEVPTKRGAAKVKVVALSDMEPAFPTKSIEPSRFTDQGNLI
jgi:hypothetical protein